MIDNNALKLDHLQFKQNRELSWLKFNERVLDEVEDPTVPVLEKLKFIAIYASNLDEFFMIRVGSLYDKSIYTPFCRDNKSDLTPTEQLEKIYHMVRILNVKYNNSYKTVEKNLRHNDIYSLEYNELEEVEKKFVQKYYKEAICPLISPQIVDSHHPFPHLINKSICIATLLKRRHKVIFGIIPIPRNLPDIILLPGDTIRYIHVEKIILENVGHIFHTYQVLEKACISVTRNADITPEDDPYDENLDFRNKMKELLHLRKKLAIVRLEISKPLSINFLEYLCKKFNILEDHVYVMDAPLRMNYVYSLINIITKDGNKHLIYPDFTPVNQLNLLDVNIMSLAAKKDMLFHYPYESMKPFLSLIKQAAYHPNVLSIKITIYRLALKATLVDYLCSAAENGKDVTVLIELRARFDEQNNIDWSEKLEDSGCKIIYGFEEYKVHSKICLITYKEKGKVKFITQAGTGNYNEKTAELYTDLSLITGKEEIGLDATEYFRNMSIGNLAEEYRHLLVAPTGLKASILRLIDREIEKKEAGKIIIKINSITDIDIINKLSEASQAGVDIMMIVRGICCILPGVPSLTENIRVISIVGRFLEHTRIFSFGKGEGQAIFISSADLMTRNLERRVEVACPIYDTDVKNEINEILEALLFDNEKARSLDSSGNYNRIRNNQMPINSQELFINKARTRHHDEPIHKEKLLTRVYKIIGKFKNLNFHKKS